jgi:hypothetical protein
MFAPEEMGREYNEMFDLVSAQVENNLRYYYRLVDDLTRLRSYWFSMRWEGRYWIRVVDYNHFIRNGDVVNSGATTELYRVGLTYDDYAAVLGPIGFKYEDNSPEFRILSQVDQTFSSEEAIKIWQFLSNWNEKVQIQLAKLPQPGIFGASEAFASRELSENDIPICTENSPIGFCVRGAVLGGKVESLEDYFGIEF